MCAPNLENQVYVGHEAEYLPYFFGQKSPGVGDTLSYTGMQVWWWLWGLILPGNQKYVSIVSMFWGACSVLWFSSWIRHQTSLLIGVGAGLWLLTTPTFLAWSTSPYNVIFPFGFGCLFLCCLQYAVVEGKNKWLYLAAAAIVWAVSLRIESVVFLFLGGGWFWAVRYPWKKWILPVIAAVVLIGITCFHLFTQEIPGEGERGLSFLLNLPLTAYHAPYDGFLGIFCLLVGALVVGKKTPRLTIVAIVGLVGNHLFMSTFNDYGFRHALFAFVLIGWIFSQATYFLNWKAVPLLLVCGFLNVLGLHDVHLRYYATEETFASYLSERYPDLPIQTLAQAKSKKCAWIGEAELIASSPPKSHFNLLQPSEVQSYFDTYGCIDWCSDHEDWRWTSLSVRDRNIRLRLLYRLQPTAIVKVDDYRCILYELVKWNSGIKTKPISVMWDTYE